MAAIVPIKNGINFRDLGGIKTTDERQIRSGMLYRSGAFSLITQEEQSYLSNELNLHYILDYRDQDEIARNPDKLWHNAKYINVPANPLSDTVTASLTSDLGSHTQALKKNSPFDFMIKLYQLLPFNNPAYKKLSSLLLTSQGKPLVQHCAVGKDRTGVGVALVLFALGVSEDSVIQDYLQTEQLLSDYREYLLSQYKNKATPDEIEKRKIIFATKKEYLTAALDAIKARYGTINEWLSQEYQLNEHNRQIIQDIYLI
ncbi:protein-tyrosine-phosphatase [Gilliamella sp. Pra-s65]|uniref:tyrosine-protein phosphatase n=1 Tax=unclassified Gilliamella TaxID=2685620 RepID=UPI0013654D6B|nr:MULTISPECIES: tyrosine-protein phosphatase [unclassified Gilliamella]MWN90853.1 protein-tyrosine-phosphatase [Gilliamella sp. Pra-s65]MWP73792.1 protein-tyrosine-phosphatase [Gilliamella sp. Pra-s52]